MPNYVQFWTPQFINYMKALERAQERLTRITPGVRDFSYMETLDSFSFEKRRLRGYLMKMFKIKIKTE